MFVPEILTVSQINFYVKSLLEENPALSNIFISGEISNFTNHYRSGHIYLSLKDSSASIRAVMFAGNAARLRFLPHNGMSVIARGKISLYEPTGEYQLYIDDMQPDGIGALNLAFEQLKNRLKAQGYFDASHKKPIPEFPETIALITSPTGAAVEDMKNILRRRYPCINIIMCPVQVQGELAPAQLIRAIKEVDKFNLADLIIVGRGGGSTEDLWAFNDESLAKAIYECNIPVISSVGHETDFTICDFVADLRAPTPSAAAELAVPDIHEVNRDLSAKLSRINTIVQSRIREIEKEFVLISSKYQLRINSIISDLNTAPLDIIKNKLTEITANRLSKDISAAERQSDRLSALNPIQVLKRGFAYVTKNESTVSSVYDIVPGDRLNLKVSDGNINAEVIAVEPMDRKF